MSAALVSTYKFEEKTLRRYSYKIFANKNVFRNVLKPVVVDWRKMFSIQAAGPEYENPISYSLNEARVWGAL